MATWQELRRYIESNYKISDDNGNTLILRFAFDGVSRSQGVFVQYYTLTEGREAWAVLESPIGKLEDLSLSQAVREVGGKVCGGIAMMESEDATWVTLRHAIPLENLDVNEFERPLQLVVVSADQLENRLTGQDSF